MSDDQEFSDLAVQLTALENAPGWHDFVIYLVHLRDMRVKRIENFPAAGNPNELHQIIGELRILNKILSSPARLRDQANDEARRLTSAGRTRN